MSNRDVIRKYGAHADAILYGHRQTGLELAICCAVVEQESGFRNIFGCDYGPQGGKPPWCHEEVTKARVAALLAQSRNNGVGLTQLTYRPFVLEAEHLGGAHIAKYQCVVGFWVMKSLIDQYGEGGMWHYNGSTAYQAQIAAKVRTWRGRLS